MRGLALDVGGELEHHRFADRDARMLVVGVVGIAAKGHAGAHDAIASDQHHRALMAEIDALVESREVVGVEQHDDDAGKRAVAVVEPARQRDQPMARPGRNRLAEKQRVVVVIDMVQEVIGIARRGGDGSRPIRCPEDGAVPGDDLDLRRKILQQQLASRPLPQSEALRVVLITAFQDQQRLIDLLQRAADMLLQGAREVRGVLAGLGENFGALAR